MNSGGRDDIRIIQQTSWLTWLLGYLHLSLLGQGFTEYRGTIPFDFDFFGQMNGLFFLMHTIYRDIPLPLVTSGCENSGNLRELALNRMKDFGAVCRDVRFREVGVSACPLFFNT